MLCRLGGYYTGSYLLTLVVMIWAWTREYRVLNRFSQPNYIPARNLLITTGIFAGSYVLRTILNFVALFDAQSLVNLQVNSCENGTDGWAILVFCIHFFGEILPLSLLFCMQISIYRNKVLKFSREADKARTETLDSERLLKETANETTRLTETVR